MRAHPFAFTFFTHNKYRNLFPGASNSQRISLPSCLPLSMVSSKIYWGNLSDFWWSWVVGFLTHTDLQSSNLCAGCWRLMGCKTYMCHCCRLQEAIFMYYLLILNIFNSIRNQIHVLFIYTKHFYFIIDHILLCVNCNYGYPPFNKLLLFLCSNVQLKYMPK